MKKTTLTVVAVVALAGLIWAQPVPGPATGATGGTDRPMVEKAGRQGMPDMMVGIPDLTPDQLDKMDALRVAHMKTVLPIRTDIRVAEIELDALWRADKLDHKKIIAKVTEIGGLRQKLELAMVNHRIDTYNLLTPDQQKAVRKMRLGRGRGMTRGQGRGMRGGMKGTGAPGPEGPRDLPD